MASLLLVNQTRANAEALAAAFAGQMPPIRVVAASASEARSLARTFVPDVAVIELDVAIGLRLVRDLLRMRPALKVFIYGSEADEREMAAWAEAGAAFIVMRSVPLADLVRLVRDAVLDRASITATKVVVHGSPGVTNLVRERPAGCADLTQRERDVLELIGLGLSNREVAATLCLELPTVKNHVQHVMRKLGVHRRADAVHYLRGHSDGLPRGEQPSGAAA